MKSVVSAKNPVVLIRKRVTFSLLDSGFPGFPKWEHFACEYDQIDAEEI